MKALPKLPEKVLVYFKLLLCNFSLVLLNMLCSATSGFPIELTINIYLYTIFIV